MSIHISQCIQQLDRAINEVRSHDERELIIEELDKLHLSKVGINTDDLRIFISLLLQKKSGITYSLKKHIIKNYLYPKNPIPNDIVINICNALGSTSSNSCKKIPPNVQAALIKWLAVSNSFLEDKFILGKLYGLLFNYLEYGNLQPSVAQLLSLATKREHVTSIRIHRLKGLCRKFNETTHLYALLLLYKDYCPDKIIDLYPKVSPRIFAFDKSSKDYITNMIAMRDIMDETRQNALDEVKYLYNFGNELKRRKKNKPRLLSGIGENENLPKIHSIEQLAYSVERIEIPKDLLSLLGDCSPYSIFTLLLKENEHIINNLFQLLGIALDDFSTLSESMKLETLQSVWRLIRILNKTPEVVVDMILMNENLLKNSSDFINHYIWKFIGYIRITSWPKFETFLRIFNSASSEKPLAWYCDFLYSISHLWRNCLLNKYSLTPEEEQNLYETISHSMEHFFTHFTSLLIKFKYNRDLALAIITVIKTTRLLPIQLIRPQDIVLPQPLINALLFMDDSICISEICGQLNFVKTVLNQTNKISQEVAQFTSLYNMYVIDTMNVIWRNKAFDTRNSRPDEASFGLSSRFINSLSTRVRIFDRNSSFQSIFNIFHSPAFASKTADIIRDLEDLDPNCHTRHAGPLTELSVKELKEDLLDDEVTTQWLETDYEKLRIDVLKELERSGYTGLAELLFSNLKSLQNKR